MSFVIQHYLWDLHFDEVHFNAEKYSTGWIYQIYSSISLLKANLILPRFSYKQCCNKFCTCLLVYTCENLSVINSKVNFQGLMDVSCQLYITKFFSQAVYIHLHFHQHYTILSIFLLLCTNICHLYMIYNTHIKHYLNGYKFFEFVIFSNC